MSCFNPHCQCECLPDQRRPFMRREQEGPAEVRRYGVECLDCRHIVIGGA